MNLAPPLTARIDHLVVAADTLDLGVQWCEATLGVTPGPGGKHALMSTHNRLLRIASDRYPRAYLEIIAIDRDAPDPGRTRWFDMDDPTLQQQLREEPRLVHFVASTPNASAALKSLGRLGIDRGALLKAERPTPRGLLQWRISVRPDGQRLFYGALPTLIEWGDVHPADTMPECGLALQSFRITHPRSAALAEALGAIGMQDVDVGEGPPNIAAELTTPLGVVRLESRGT